MLVLQIMAVDLNPLLTLTLIARIGEKGSRSDLFGCMMEIEYLNTSMQLKRFPITLGTIGNM